VKPNKMKRKFGSRDRNRSAVRGHSVRERSGIESQTHSGSNDSTFGRVAQR
jgi:hypothetical protein